MCFAVTGLDIWASLLSTGVICTLYTTVVSEPWPLRGLVDDSRREAPSQLPVPLPDWTPGPHGQAHFRCCWIQQPRGALPGLSGP